MVFACTQLFAETRIKGSVVTEDGKPLSGAKIVVFSGLGSFLMLRTDSDRNGNYRLQLAPGPFRLMVLKKGFLPHFATFTLRSDVAEESFQHVLQPDLQVGENRQIKVLKHILRSSNRSPLRQTTEQELPGRAEAVHSSGASLQGSLQSQRRSGDGNGSSSSLAVEALLPGSLLLLASMDESFLALPAGMHQQSKYQAQLAYDAGAWRWVGQGAWLDGEEGLSMVSPGQTLSSHWTFRGSHTFSGALGWTELGAGAEEASWLQAQQLWSHRQGAEQLTASVQWNQWRSLQFKVDQMAVRADWSRQHGSWAGLSLSANSLAAPEGRWTLFQMQSGVHYAWWQEHLSLDATWGLTGWNGEARLAGLTQLSLQTGQFSSSISHQDGEALVSYGIQEVSGTWGPAPLNLDLAHGFGATRRRGLAAALEWQAANLRLTLNVQRTRETWQALSTLQGPPSAAEAGIKGDRAQLTGRFHHSGTEVELLWQRASNPVDQRQQSQLSLSQQLLNQEDSGLQLSLLLCMASTPFAPGWWYAPTEEQPLRAYSGALRFSF
jgi:hypothetical protein